MDHPVTVRRRPGRRLAMGALFAVAALAVPADPAAAAQEYWDTYGFVEPYGGRRFGVIGDRTDSWKAGVRLGRVGWLAGWEFDLLADPDESGSGDRYQVSLDGFIKPFESGPAAILVLVGLGATTFRGGPDPDDSVFFHYRYGLAYRHRWSARFGLRAGVTALRSRAGDFSCRDATVGWIVYF